MFDCLLLSRLNLKRWAVRAYSFATQLSANLATCRTEEKQYRLGPSHSRGKPGTLQVHALLCVHVADVHVEDLGTLPLPSVTPCDNNAWCVCQEG
jgi:hypothetical protein